VQQPAEIRKAPARGRGFVGWRISTAKVLGLDYPKNGDTEPVVINKSLIARWHDRPVAEITGTDIAAAVREAVADGIPGLEVRTVGPSDSRGRSLMKALSKMFSWSVAHDLVAVNPCLGRHKPPPPKSRHRVLSAEEIRKVWMAADALGQFGSVIKLLLLTGARRSEVDGMRWSELSADLATWNLPPERVKNAKPHFIPLPETARSIVAAVPRRDGSDLVFSTTGDTSISGWSKVKKKLDALVGFSDWRVHDIRRSFATHITELNIAPPHITEVLLGHVSGHKANVAGVYNRALHIEERRVALERWADRIAALVADRPAAEAVPLIRGQR
jgi:integrase